MAILSKAASKPTTEWRRRPESQLPGSSSPQEMSAISYRNLWEYDPYSSFPAGKCREWAGFCGESGDLPAFPIRPVPWYIHRRVPGAWNGGCVGWHSHCGIAGHSSFRNPLAMLATCRRMPVPPPIVSELGNKVDIKVLRSTAEHPTPRPFLASERRALARRRRLFVEQPDAGWDSAPAGRSAQRSSN